MDYEERLLRLAAYPQQGDEVVVTGVANTGDAVVTKIGPIEEGIPLFVEVTSPSGNRSSFPGSMWADAVLSTCLVAPRELPPMPQFTEAQMRYLDRLLNTQEDTNGLVQMTAVGNDEQRMIFCRDCRRQIASTHDHHEWTVAAGHTPECLAVLRHDLLLKVRHWQQRRKGGSVRRYAAVG